MTTALGKNAKVTAHSDASGDFLEQRTRTQYAALCYRQTKKGPKVLLITSRNTRRWLIPKGWPMRDLSARRAAQIEAYEEAGIRGKAEKKPLGEYQTYKDLGGDRKVRVRVVVYPLKYEASEKKFPERGQRETEWLSLKDAAKRCDIPGLRDLLQSSKLQSKLKAA